MNWRAAAGHTTRFIKVRAHRGEPLAKQRMRFRQQQQIRILLPPPRFPPFPLSSFFRPSLYTLLTTPPATADNVDAGLDCCCRAGAPWALAGVDFSFCTATRQPELVAQGAGNFLRQLQYRPHWAAGSALGSAEHRPISCDRLALLLPPLRFPGIRIGF